MGGLIAKMTLRVRLTLLVGLLALIVTVDQGFEIAEERDASVADIRARAVEVAVAGAASQADAIAATRTLLGVVKDLPLGEGAACSGRLEQIRAGAPSITILFRSGKEGVTNCSSGGGVGVVFNDRPYFIEMMETRAAVTSEFNIGRVSKRPGIVIGVPKIENGEVVGGLFARIDAFWLSTLAEGPAARSGATVLLMDANLTVIAAAPNPDRWIGRNFADEPGLSKAFAQPKGVDDAEAFAGEPHIIGHARLSDSGEVVAVAIPKAAVLAPFGEKAQEAMVKLGLMMLATLLLIWLGTERFIMRPLSAFAERARRIGDGDLDTQETEATVLPELRPLGLTIERMAEKLAAREAELREANERLASLAATDPLTGLANRRHFQDRGAEEWARAVRDGNRIAALALDVDHFKRFNDRYGHSAGDECLRKIAEVLVDNARRPGDLAARTGGEEFVVILPGARIEDAIQIAKAIGEALAALAIPHEASETGSVTLSIGVAAAKPGRGDQLEDLLEAADGALYEAKRQGRSRIVVAGPHAVRLAG